MSYSWTYVACKCPYNPYIGVSASNYYMKTVLVRKNRKIIFKHSLVLLSDMKKKKFVVFKWSRMPTLKFQKSS